MTGTAPVPILVVQVVEAFANPSPPTRRLLEMAKAWPDSPPDDLLPPATEYRTLQQMRPEEVGQAITLHESGLNMQQIANQLGVHRTNILKRFQNLGIVTRPSKLSPDQVRSAAKLYGDGWTLDKIARRFHASNSTVREYLLADGVELRPRGRSRIRGVK